MLAFKKVSEDKFEVRDEKSGKFLMHVNNEQATFLLMGVCFGKAKDFDHAERLMERMSLSLADLGGGMTTLKH
jgi:hypothetical protein